MEFLSSEVVQRRLLKELGWFPPRPGAWEVLDDETRRAAEGFIAMKTQVRARPLIEDYEAISELWQTAVANVLFNNVEPEEAIRGLTQSLRRQPQASSER